MGGPQVKCEDYPCCGHTPQDPCEPQWYDKPGAFDTTKNPHALCDHENGECDVVDDEDLETCSWCTTEVPDDTLIELEDGARICRDCEQVNA